MRTQVPPMTFRQLFFRTLAFLIAGLMVYVWLGVAWINGQLSPWIYEMFSG